MKPYDPALREAAEEFKALCRKYDCMGVALFVSPTHSEFVNVVSPTWSVMKLTKVGDDETEVLRFRSKREDFPSKEEQDRVTNATVHGVTSVVEWTRRTNESWENILSFLRTKMRIMHRAWGDPDSVPGDGL